MNDAATAIVATGFFTTIAITVTQIGGILRARAERRAAALPSETEARLERIEQAVEAIAIEVERIAETQRFTLKLEAEREGRRPVGQLGPRAEGRAVTPQGQGRCT